MSLPDPNWLLSSLAQSAAAVVAIVAGFIMSRILALASERGGVLSRLKEIRATHHLKNNQRKIIVDRMHAFDVREALYNGMNSLVESAGQLSSEGFMNGHLRREGDDEETDLRLIPSQRRSSGPVLTAPCGVPPDFLGSSIWSQNQAERRERSYDSFVKEERSLARDCELLEAEIGRLSRRVNTLARPQGLRSGLWASAYFSASGIVLPLLLMPAPADLFVRALSIRWRSYTVNLPLFKWLVLAAFLSGFVWLIGYVIYAARSLSTADQDLLDARIGEGG